jgi:excisionase family DNA binding protein
LKLKTISEIADTLRLKPSTIYHMTARKEIPFYKIGSRVLFDPDKVEEWLQSKAVEPGR